jgi:16S rRNA (uracil1498-N3)-methyltransferase
MQNSRQAPPLSLPEPISSIIALVGPEGGFTDREVDLAKAHGFTPIHFGPRILKADTAAVAVAAVVQYVFGDLGERGGREV